MVSDRGGSRRRGEFDVPEDASQRLLPELLRRVLGLGLSGLFMTEGALRKALGDTLPQDWIDFAVDQSERTRAEFLERLASEISRSVQTIDLASLVEGLLEGHTVEVKAQIRFRSRKSKGGGKTLRFSLAEGGRPR